MKHLKSIFLSLTVIALSLFLFVLQINIALKATLLSPDWFGKLADDSRLSTAVIEALDIPDGSSIYGEAVGKTDEMPPLKAVFLDSMDRPWLESQTPVLLKGIYSYMAGVSETLPVLDFKPVKQNILDISMKEFEKISQKYSAEKKVKEKAGLEERLKLNQIKDNLDMNVFVEELYHKHTSPLHAARELIAKYNSAIFYPLLSINILILSILLLASFNVKQSSGWLSFSFIISGLLGILAGTLAKNGALINYQVDSSEKAGEIILMIKDTVFSSFSKVMIVQSVIALIAGLLLVIVWIRTSRALNMKNQGIFTARIVIIIALIISIPFIMTYGVKSFRVSLEKVTESITDSEFEFEKLDFKGAMVSATGAELLNEEFDPSNAVDDRTAGVLMSVFVEVTDNSGKPVGGTVLTINKDRPDGPKDPGYFATDKDGRVKFSLKAGKYYIKPSEYGFPPKLKMPKQPIEVEVKKDVENSFKIILERE